MTSPYAYIVYVIYCNVKYTNCKIKKCVVRVIGPPLQRYLLGAKLNFKGKLRKTSFSVMAHVLLSMYSLHFPPNYFAMHVVCNKIF